MTPLLLMALLSTPNAPTSLSIVDARASAVRVVASTDPACTALGAYYYEIGDKTSARASGSVGTPAVLASTKMPIASASKWLYAMAVVQTHAPASSDVPFLNFTSGYTGMGNTGDCQGYATVSACLAQAGFATQTAANVGHFYYDSGHLENHAAQLTSWGTLALGPLGAAIGTQLGVSITYTQPLMAGGVYTSAATYAAVLRGVLTGTLKMSTLLDASPVCTLKSATCNALSTPMPRAWHYSLGHWIEDDATGDGAYSSPGKFGFYPWIDKTKTSYGVIARQAATGTEQQGYASAQCGQKLRSTWSALQ